MYLRVGGSRCASIGETLRTPSQGVQIEGHVALEGDFVVAGVGSSEGLPARYSTPHICIHTEKEQHRERGTRTYTHAQSMLVARLLIFFVRCARLSPCPLSG
jgi:hypothetical protein